MRSRRLPILLSLLSFACGPSGVASTDAGPDGPPTPTDPDAGADADAAVPPPPPVRIVNGALELGGKPTMLFGGEVQYFRVRDPGFDAEKTQAMWKDTFARMRAAKMNLVTTYFAWDYHQRQDGTWDFTGARDVDAFLSMACAEGLKVIAKPGPLITAEWPRGFGSFGAVPDWWKQANPDALAKKSDGSSFDFNAVPLGTPSLQPSVLHPKYLAAVDGWYAQILPIVKKHVATRCVVAVQVDNETNLYWADRFGSVDYNPVAIDHFHKYLAAKWGTIGALNAAYGKSYASFDAVPAPTKLPAQPADNVPARDWYDAGVALVADYLGLLRQKIEAAGIVEPDVLFMTNDSPFTIVDTVANAQRNILVHDGTMKNRFGLAGLDTYPKQIPDVPLTDGPLANFPFQADYYTKLYGENGKLYTKDPAHPFVFGAELQGGFYSLPAGVKPVVSPQSTDQMLAKTLGHGLKGASFYVLRGGLNADGSEYDFQAALGPDGSERPRMDVYRRWAAFSAKYNDALAYADDVEDAVAIVNDLAYAVPQAGTNDNHQRLYTTEYAGLYGWLLGAGFNPAVVEARTQTNLSRFRAVLFLAPKMVAPKTAKLLTDFHAKGGMVVQFLDPGAYALDGAADAEVSKLAALYPLDPDGSWTWPGLPTTVRSGDLNSKVPGADGPVKGYWYQTYWAPKQGAQTENLLVERKAITYADGKPVGVLVKGPGAPRALLGTHVATGFGTDAYYGLSLDELGRKRALARYLMQAAGVTPSVYTYELRALAWGRRGPTGPLFVFVENDDDARSVHVQLADLARLGLAPGKTYVVSEGLSGQTLGTYSGADIAGGPFILPMTKYGTAVLVVAEK
jgi:hypothetical protein